MSPRSFLRANASSSPHNKSFIKFTDPCTVPTLATYWSLRYFSTFIVYGYKYLYRYGYNIFHEYRIDSVTTCNSINWFFKLHHKGQQNLALSHQSIQRTSVSLMQLWIKTKPFNPLINMQLIPCKRKANTECSNKLKFEEYNLK
jgi:hypothetical protein